MATPEPRPDPIDGMTTVLGITFFVIGAGYYLRSRNVMSKEAGSGIGQLIGKVVLPALLFKGMATLNLSGINWALIGAMTLGKLTVFVVVAVYVLATDSRADKVTIAGVYAVFVTQSNDLAIGFPIVSALYPEYVPYLFLGLPFQLAVLTPMSFVLMEIGQAQAKRKAAAEVELEEKAKAAATIMEEGGDSGDPKRKAADGGEGGAKRRGKRSQKPKQAGGCATATKIFRNVVTNPVVASTMLGLLYNAIFGGAMPTVVLKGLTFIGNAFGLCALFNLGMAIVGRLGVLRGSAVVLPLSLSLMKTLVMPILFRLIMGVLDPNAATDALNFLYILGTCPTAPAVFVYATQYNVIPAIIAGATVLCTMLSAPLLYITTVLLSATTPGAFTAAIVDSSTLLSGFSIAGATWIIVSFILFPRQRRFPKDLIFYLALSQLLYPAFHISCDAEAAQDGGRNRTGVQVVFAIAEMFRYWQFVWVCIIMYNTVLIVRGGAEGRMRGLGLRKVYHPFTWLFSITVTVIVHGAGVVDQGFAFPCIWRYGRPQAVVDFVFLFIVLCIITVMLIKMQRTKPQGPAEVLDLTQYGRSRRASVQARSADASGGGSSRSRSRTRSSAAKPNPALLRAASGSEAGDIAKDDKAKDGPGPPVVGDKFRTMLIGAWFALSLLLKLTIIITYLAGDDLVSGAILQVMFIAQTLEYGSGFVTVLTFGFQKELLELWAEVWDKLYVNYRKKLFGAQDIAFLSSSAESRSPELLSLLLAMANPDSGLIANRRYLFKTYKQVMVGSEVVDWLYESGRVTDRVEGEKLGKRLVDLGFIMHVTDEHHFEDSGAFYRLIPVEERPPELVKLIAKMRDPESGLVADRRWRIRKFNQCVVGYEVVGWMVEEGHAATREEAVRLGQECVFHHMLKHVTGDHNFKDEELYFCFCDDSVNPLYTAESGRFVGDDRKPSS